MSSNTFNKSDNSSCSTFQVLIKIISYLNGVFGRVIAFNISFFKQLHLVSGKCKFKILATCRMKICPIFICHHSCYFFISLANFIPNKWHEFHICLFVFVHCPSKCYNREYNSSYLYFV